MSELTPLIRQQLTAAPPGVWWWPTLAYNVGRPPSDVAPTRRCQGVTVGGIGSRCRGFASWLLPEIGYCLQHLPEEYRSLAVARRDLWMGYAADAWQQVLADCPWATRPEDEAAACPCAGCGHLWRDHGPDGCSVFVTVEPPARCACLASEGLARTPDEGA